MIIYDKKNHIQNLQANLMNSSQKSWQKPVCGEKKEEINKPK